MRRTRNPVYVQAYREFESHPVRQRIQAVTAIKATRHGGFFVLWFTSRPQPAMRNLCHNPTMTMTAFIPASIALLCSGVTFLSSGLALNSPTFMILGAVFMAVGTPMAIVTLTRRTARAR